MPPKSQRLSPKEEQDRLEYITTSINDLCDAALGVPGIMGPSFMGMYSAVYSLCTASVHTAGLMYYRMLKWSEDILPTKVKKRLSMTDLVNLTEVCHVYSACNTILKWMKSTFNYLDRYFSQRNGVNPTQMLVVKAFRKALPTPQSLPALKSLDDDALRLLVWHPYCLKAVSLLCLTEEPGTPVPWDCFREIIDLYVPADYVKQCILRDHTPRQLEAMAEDGTLDWYFDLRLLETLQNDATAGFKVALR